jgi:hypothetical protein
MQFSEVITAIFQHGGTVIMAALFVWVFVEDKRKNTKILEDNTKMLQTLAESNQNIAKSLDIITNNLVSIDRKVDRNYEEIVKHEK